MLHTDLSNIDQSVLKRSHERLVATSSDWRLAIGNRSSLAPIVDMVNKSSSVSARDAKSYLADSQMQSQGVRTDVSPHGAVTMVVRPGIEQEILRYEGYRSCLFPETSTHVQELHGRSCASQGIPSGAN